MAMRRLGIGFVGFVAGIAYAASCRDSNSLLADGGVASQVAYANGHSGLKATTVQAAIDEIGTTARRATSESKTALLDQGGLIRSAFGDEGTATTWNVKATKYNTETDTLDVVDYGTITFTEGATAGQGTYTVSDRNLLIDLGYSPTLTDHTQFAEPKGKYFLIGGSIVVAGKLKAGGGGGGGSGGGGASGQTLSNSWPFALAEAGSTMTINVSDVSYSLTKQ